MRFYCFNIAVDDLSQSDALAVVKKLLRDGKQHYIVTPNPEMVLLAMQDRYFSQSLLKSDLSLTDGYGLYLAMRLAGCHLKGRVTGADFLNNLLSELAESVSFYFLGGERGTAKLAASSAKQIYGATIVGEHEPDRHIYNYANGEIHVSDTSKHRLVIEDINSKSPDILIVALGHGQQEKWLFKFLTECPGVKVGIGVGGALDYLAGRSQRAPKFMRSLGLEWLWRMLVEPTRWRRIFDATVIFPLKALGWLINMRLKYRPLVVGCILNTQGQVLLVERVGIPNHWQFPQGGRELDEKPLAAVRREMLEEVGLDRLIVIGQSKPDVYRYRWKKIFDKDEDEALGRRRYYGFAGQSVTVFYLRFKGSNDDVKVDNQELTAYQWVSLDKLLSVIHPIRRPLAKIILRDLRSRGFARQNQQ